MADEPSPPKKLRELLEDEADLHRWIGEGGSARDGFGVLARIQVQLETYRNITLWQLLDRHDKPKDHERRPGEAAGTYERTQRPVRVRRTYVPFADYTRPGERAFGFYMIRVPAWGYSQLVRASHATAARIARSRTQYGDSELYFLEPIDTPALD